MSLIKENKAKLLIQPVTKLPKNTHIVQVITANNPSGAMIKTTHVMRALMMATNQLR